MNHTLVAMVIIVAVFTEAENRAEYESWLLCSDSNIGCLRKPRVKKETEEICFFYHRIVSPISHIVKQKFHLFMQFREDTVRSHSCQGYFSEKLYTTKIA